MFSMNLKTRIRKKPDIGFKTTVNNKRLAIASRFAVTEVLRRFAVSKKAMQESRQVKENR
jgi:hypothetical protein